MTVSRQKRWRLKLIFHLIRLVTHRKGSIILTDWTASWDLGEQCERGERGLLNANYFIYEQTRLPNELKDM